jgi:hypothetical protein
VQHERDLHYGERQKDEQDTHQREFDRRGSLVFEHPASPNYASFDTHHGVQRRR